MLRNKPLRHTRHSDWIDETTAPTMCAAVHEADLDDDDIQDEDPVDVACGPDPEPESD
jgi:hypothetical protein